MAEYLLPIGSLYMESEFNAGVGACGPTALAVGGRWTLQQRGPNAIDMMKSMQRMGLCGPTGVTNIPNLETAARTLHYPVQVRGAGQTPLDYAAATFKGTYGNQGVCVYECTNGQVLRDYVLGAGEDATNLQNHIFALVGYNSGGYSNFLGMNVPEGFFACDGANGLSNPIVAGVGRVHRYINTLYCYYTKANLLQARPYDCFSVTR